LRIVFLGTSEFAAAILERLAHNNAHRPVLVLTRPDRRQGRGRRSAAPPVARAARSLGLAVCQPESVNSREARAEIAGVAPRLLVVCAFGALIREPLLSEHELLNVHPSLLPRWRGAAPIERAIMAGDPRTGVSIMRLTAGLDSGPVCLAEFEPIGGEDSYGTLAARLQALAAELLLRVLDLTESGHPPPFREQDEQGATYAEKISADDRLLDPTRTAAELQRVVRALEPHIGARVALADGSLLGVHRAAALDSDRSPGARADPRRRGLEGEPLLGVVASDGRLLLECRGAPLELLVVQPPGGRVMEAAAYLRGHRLTGRR
jgi:methionyl-tRNA formyltransferase